MAKLDPHIAAHLEWLGFVRPTGLVVSAPALVRAGVILNRRDAEGQRLLRTCFSDEAESSAESGPRLADFRTFAETVLDWSFSPKGYAGTPEVPVPADLLIELPEFGHVHGPDFAIRTEALKTAPAAASALNSDAGTLAMTPQSDAVGASAAQDEPSPWQLLVTVIDHGEDFDATSAGGSELSAHGRMERLLRHTRTPAGLIFNGVALRLVSAPAGESSGWLDFRVADMLQTAGRPICSAMRELLSQTRLLAVPADKRLAALLRESRKFQNEVSERLAEQVLHALYELLRGFQAAHDASRGELLRRQLRDEPDEIYRGLLTVVLRLVFLLYAEERDMLPQDEMFLGAYSVSGLYARLREDAALHPDTMDQRFGAYAQLLALWRMVHDGVEGPNVHLAPRHGDLFHPDSYPFLEGRGGERGDVRQTHERIDPPLLPDGTIHRVLEKLIVLDAERISYRALDVEHIGSVYETMMGFRLETATGRSAAIKAAKKHGAPATINLEELLVEAPGKRAKWLRDRTDRKITAGVNKAVQQIDLQSGGTVSDLHAALDSVIDKNATPDLVPVGAMVLQPSEERRRSGSHYTPRELTEPIVRIALEPIFNRLRVEAGGPLRPEQVLDLKVCDPAMGSGAFLVEACRQLADTLIESWHAHDALPATPPDDDVTIYARRLVAQRCLYGVDRNPKAVDLAKLSLWLTTLAKEHPLTFLDHSLRHGDSLVGLSIPQIQAFHWKGDAPNFEDGFEALRGREHLGRAAELRQQIREADDSVSDRELRELWDEAQSETAAVRLLGDLVVAAFFDKLKSRERETRREEFANKVIDNEASTYRQWLNDLRYADPPLAPFHWPLEFPEVFDREDPGFDTVVGNPPFLGGRNITAVQGDSYSNWLLGLHERSSGGADLAAHFFRRAHALTSRGGTVGLIATNTISQGDTRASGLQWICTNGSAIYHARRRIKWPGLAAVVVSIVHVTSDTADQTYTLDGETVDGISAFLLPGNLHYPPASLLANNRKSFQGSIVLGVGFTFDDRALHKGASSIECMHELLGSRQVLSEAIRPFIGAREVNSNPIHANSRWVIDFGERSLDQCILRYPELVGLVEARVKPERVTKNAQKYPRMVDEWWKHWNARPELYARIESLDYVLATASSAATFHMIARVDAPQIFSHKLIIFPFETWPALCCLQSRVHECWSAVFGATFGDALTYNPTDVFETFPFPLDWDTRADLEDIGERYHEFRATLMVRKDEGMTKTYSRFHDSHETDADIAELRRLHAAMDRAVLDAYGWSDIPTDCEFLLDYEIDEETWGNKRKPYRYRWPDDIRDEVLARLLELNGERATEEARAGLAEAKRPASARRPSPRRRPVPSVQSPASGTLWGTAASADSADLG